MPFITEPREHKKLKLNAFFLVSGCSFHCRSLAMHTAKKPEHLAINKHCKSTFFRGLFFVCASASSVFYGNSLETLLWFRIVVELVRGVYAPQQNRKKCACIRKKSIAKAGAINQSSIFVFVQVSGTTKDLKARTAKTSLEAKLHHRWKGNTLKFNFDLIEYVMQTKKKRMKPEAQPEPPRTKRRVSFQFSISRFRTERSARG